MDILEYFVLFVFIITLFIESNKFVKNIKRSEGEEEIRQVVVPYFLFIILFVSFIFVLFN
ncbi:hypothetical protein [Aquibacillus sediminis]|uniref:hypothetical protein n=1 Tax=Aquibacillus sediminis TaxID=2574734 RepID=UPI001109CF92|nr:hypothetical protein [Aquibacillus sediminis]